MNIEQLNSKYFILYSQLNEARPFLPQKQFTVMNSALLDQYNKELEVTVSEWMLQHGTAIFIQRFNVRMYLPHRTFFGWNKIAKKLLKELKTEFLETIRGETVEDDDIKQPPTEAPTTPQGLPSAE